MKRLITIMAIAVVSLNFVSCRQDDDSSEFSTNSTQEMLSNKQVLSTPKADSVVIVKKEVDPDPPYKDPTRW